MKNMNRKGRKGTQSFFADYSFALLCVLRGEKNAE